jgi:hypothetical protein
MISKIYKIICNKYNNEIFHIIYPSQYLLTSSLIRIQEFDANSENRNLTLENILDTYAYKYGHISYFSDWSAFNITNEIINKFFYKFNKSFSQKEKDFFYIIKKNIKKWKTERYCLICSTNKKSDFNHELAHSFYYLYEDYRIEMDKLVKNCQYFSKIKKKLNNIGYDNDSIIDECQAYLATGSKIYLKQIFNLNLSSNLDSFKNIFKKFKKNIKYEE